MVSRNGPASHPPPTPGGAYVPAVRAGDLLLQALVVWGKSDHSSKISKPEAYRRDRPNAAVVQILEAEHIALDTAADEITLHIREFIIRAEPR
jgi:hypothetical protein